MRGILFVIGVLMMVSCDFNKSHEEVIDEPIEVDSTWFYDSIYSAQQLEIEDYFENLHNSNRFNGNVLIAQNGNIIFQDCYGVASKKKHDTLTLDHTFQLASASKIFTAVAALKLVEEGKIQLSDSIQKFIPEFPYSGIDIDQLLSHRSGLSKYTHFCDNPDTIWPDKSVTICNNDVCKIMCDIKPNASYSPNRKHYYCNTNYVLLASIIERVTKNSFSNYLKQNIFIPAGMTQTVLYDRTNQEELKLPTTGYTGNMIPCIDIYLNGCVGDKGIYSSVGDLLKFERYLYSGKLISQKFLDMATSPQNKVKSDGKSYGYGFRTIAIDGHGTIPYHTGWWKGFRTYFIFIPEKAQTIIVLSNIKRGPFLKIQELVDLLQ